MDAINKIIELLKEYSVNRIALVGLLSSFIIIKLIDDKTNIYYQSAVVAAAISGSILLILIFEMYFSFTNAVFDFSTGDRRHIFKKMAIIRRLSNVEKEFIEIYIESDNIPDNKNVEIFTKLYKLDIVRENLIMTNGEVLNRFVINEWVKELTKNFPFLLKKQVR